MKWALGTLDSHWGGESSKYCLPSSQQHWLSYMLKVVEVKWTVVARYQAVQPAKSKHWI